MIRLPTNSLCLSALAILVLGLSVCLSPRVAVSLGRLGDVQRVIELIVFGCVLILVGVAHLKRWVDKEEVRQSFNGLYFVGILCCIGAVIVSARSEFPLRSFQDFGLFAGIAAVFLLLQARLKSFVLGELESIGALLLIPGVIYSIQLISLYIEMVTFGGFGLTYAKLPNFSNFRSFNNLQAILIPFYLFYALVYKGSYYKVVRVVARAAVFIWCLALLYTGARSVIVAFCCVLVFGAIFYPSLLKPYIKDALKFFVWLVLGYGLLFLVVPYFLEGVAEMHAARTYTGHRRQLWAYAIGKLPGCFWGCGGQSFAALTSRSFVAPWGSPHNTILSFLIEYGVLLGAAMLCLILKVAKILTDSVKNVFELALLSSILACGIDSLFSGAIYAPVASIALPIVMAFLLSRVDAKYGVDSKIQVRLAFLRPYIRMILFTFLYGLFFLSAWISFWDLRLYGDKLSEPGFSYPRFWEVGNFFL